ncbi:MAG: family N-acetyltransferase [Frankiales bacterium]|nr:family N-acetyltransferase [Frankiales bacterium]
MTLRPLLPEDVPAARLVANAALAPLLPLPEETPENVARGELRISHLQRTDPGSCWAAEQDGRLVGFAVALVREGMWFLSLLMVDPGYQSRGLGKQLLDAALSTATDRSWILATVDPPALRRYRRAGFDLVPCLTAGGTVDRALLPAVDGVREGTWQADGSFVDDVVRSIRGAGMTPDLPYLDELGCRLFVTVDGFAVLRKAGLMFLGARTPASAQKLLWTALAESPMPIEIDWLAHDQQWAVDVCLDARLPLLKGEGHLFLRGQPPMSPYLPGGALG